MPTIHIPITNKSPVLVGLSWIFDQWKKGVRMLQCFTETGSVVSKQDQAE